MATEAIIGSILAGTGSMYSNLLGAGLGMLGQKQAQNYNDQFTAWQNQFAAEEAEKARLFNAGEAAKGREFEEYMWNKNNEYNTPQAQLQRLLATGMNPITALSMMSGSDSVGQLAANPAVASGPAAAANSGASVGQGGSELAASMLGGVPKSIADMMSQIEDYKAKRMVNAFTPEQQKKIIEQFDAEINRMKEQANLSAEEAKTVDAMRDWLVNEKEETVRSIRQSIVESEKRVEKIDKDIEAESENIKYIKASTVKQYAEAGLATAQKLLTEKQADVEAGKIPIQKQELEKIKKENYLLELQKAWESKGIDHKLSGPAQLMNYIKVMCIQENSTLNDLTGFVKHMLNGEPQKAFAIFEKVGGKYSDIGKVAGGFEVPYGMMKNE